MKWFRSSVRLWLLVLLMIAMISRWSTLSDWLIANAVNLSIYRPSLASTPSVIDSASDPCRPGSPWRLAMKQWSAHLFSDQQRAGTDALIAYRLAMNSCTAEAAAWFGEAAWLSPHNPVVAYRLGSIQEMAGQREQALARYRAAPTIAYERVRRAQTADAAGDWAKAYDEYRWAIEIAPALPDGYYGLGQVLSYHRDEQEGAIAAYEQAVKFGYSDGFVWSRIAHANVMAGRPTMAVQILDAHARHDSLAEAIRGQVLQAEGQPAQAIGYYLLSLQQSPNDPYVYLALGRAYQATGQIAQAVAAWQRALAVSPGFAPAVAELCQLQHCPASSP